MEHRNIVFIAALGIVTTLALSAFADDSEPDDPYPDNPDCVMGNYDSDECQQCHYLNCDDDVPDDYEFECGSNALEIWCFSDEDSGEDSGCSVSAVRGGHNLHNKLLIVFVMCIVGVLALVRSRRIQPPK